MGKPGVQVEQLTGGLRGDRPAGTPDPAVPKTRPAQSRLHLSVGDYTLFCAPFQVSSERGLFLALLRPPEADLFRSMGDTPCSATLTLGADHGSFSIRLPGRLERISALSGWPDACLLDVSLPACPEELLRVLAISIDAFRGLGKVYASLAGSAIDLTATNAALLRIDGSARLRIMAEASGATVTTLAVDRLSLRLFPPFPPIQAGEACTARLNAASGPFEVPGTIVQALRREDGDLDVLVAADFTPRLVELVDDFVARRRLIGLKAAG
jgi:hypothetical protein